MLLPVRDHRADYLRAAVDSLLRQTEPDWRALVVVEADRVESVSEELDVPLRDSRLSVVVNEGRLLSGAFNTGMRHATTPFVAVLLADDLWFDTAVEVLNANIRSRPEVDFFHTGRRIIDDDGMPISTEHAPRPDVTLDDFATRAPVKHLMCWRRSLALEVGGMDETLNSIGPDDLDFPWTMAEHGATFGAIDECLYIYRDHRSHPRLTTHLPKSVQIEELRRIFGKHDLPKKVARRRLRHARKGHLRQAMFRTRLHQRIANALGLRGGGRRERYR